MYTEETLIANIGHNMKVIREANGMTQRNLAKQLGVTPSCIGKIELCYPKTCSLRTLYKFCNLFDITIGEMCNDRFRAEVEIKLTKETSLG